MYQGKTFDFGTIDEIHSKCHFIFGSIENGNRQPVLFSFPLDRRPVQK